MEPPLLILDLDETLIRATESEPAGRSDFRVSRYWVRRRPHVGAFLREVGRAWELAVWTSSSEAYAAAVVRNVFPEDRALRFVWSRSRCTPRYDEASGETHFLKDLKKVRRLGFDLARVLILDDSPEKLSRHRGNHLLVRPWEGETDDRELLDLLPYLEWLSAQPDFRTVEKRTWRGARP